jgi:hypothetical protein
LLLGAEELAGLGMDHLEPEVLEAEAEAEVV